MRAAIEEAERARGATGDNPWVGAVIVVGGAIVARGRTHPPGESHAEAAAIQDARARGIEIAGATLYTTLEPCSFHGRTPACARAIVERGIARVVIGLRDPDPRVDGAGARILRDAGIEVIEGVCAPEVLALLAPWMAAYHAHRAPR